MNGFTAKLTQHVEASLKTGQPSLMTLHLEKLQKRKDEEAAIEAARAAELRELQEEQERGRRKKEKKKHKHKKEKKAKKEKKRKHESSSSSESEEDELIKAAFALEKQKLEDLRRREEDRRVRAEEKRRRRQQEEDSSRRASEEAGERDRLQEYEDGERDRHFAQRSDQLLSGSIEAIGKCSISEKDARVPLRYLSQHSSMAWETLGPGGQGILFAPLIGVTGKAAKDDDDDEW